MEDASTKIETTDQLKTVVSNITQSQSIYDIHTHLFSPPFCELLLWGIDELLTYHYLIAEVFRSKLDITYHHFWHMTKTQQADLIWKTLFIENSPISEACRGVVTTLNALGLDVDSRNLQNLKLSNTVEDILQLDLKLVKPTSLKVRLKGQLTQLYVNGEPTLIEIEGTCPLPEEDSKT